MTSLYDNEEFMEQVIAALAYVKEDLAHEVWSRNLDDNDVSYAFCVPAALYANKKKCKLLKRWIKDIFAYYGISTCCTWNDSSRPAGIGRSIYEVDWCGSRYRSVNIGPHMYMKLSPRMTKGELPHFRQFQIPLWHTYSVSEDCFNDTINVVEIKTSDLL